MYENVMHSVGKRRTRENEEKNKGQWNGIPQEVRRIDCSWGEERRVLWTDKHGHRDE